MDLFLACSLVAAFGVGWLGGMIYGSDKALEELMRSLPRRREDLDCDLHLGRQPDPALGLRAVDGADASEVGSGR